MNVLKKKKMKRKLPVGPKIPKLVPEEELFATTYYEFPGNFTTNLKGSKKISSGFLRCVNSI